MNPKTFLFCLTFVSFITGSAQVSAPDFTLDDSQGTTRSLYQELDQGKIVVLDFFSTLCGTCQTNTPVLEEIWNNFGYGGDSLWVWGVEAGNAQDSAINVFRNQFNVTFPCYSTFMDDIVLPLYHILYTPQYFVVCPDHYMKQYSVNNIVAGIQGCLPTQDRLTDNRVAADVCAGEGRISVNAEQETLIEVYTVQGLPVYSGRIHPGEKHLIGNLNPGIYIYFFSTENSDKGAGKVLVY